MAKVELQFWKREYAPAPISIGVSAVTHALVIGAWVVMTLPGMITPPPEAAGKVLYFPPPDPEPALASSVESIRYVELAPEGQGVGVGPMGETGGVELDVGRRRTASVGNVGRDSVDAPEQRGTDGTDSVFTLIEVDTAATRLPESAAPRYPAALLDQRVQGKAIVRFIVDTTGLADPESFSVVLATHQEFAQSVRDALPGMRFSTARIGSAKVRQLVELPFTFNIAQPTSDTATVRAASRRRPE